MDGTLRAALGMLGWSRTQDEANDNIAPGTVQHYDVQDYNNVAGNQMAPQRDLYSIQNYNVHPNQPAPLSPRQPTPEERDRSGVPPLRYNLLRFNVSEQLTDRQFKMMKCLLQQCPQTMEGIPVDVLNAIPEEEKELKLLDCMQNYKYLGPYNMWLLQALMYYVGNPRAYKEVLNYVTEHCLSKNPLYVFAPGDIQGPDVAKVKLKITGDIRHFRNIDVEEFRRVLADRCQGDCQYVILTGQEQGSVVLHFQISSKRKEVFLRQGDPEDLKRWCRRHGIIEVHVDDQNIITMSASVVVIPSGWRLGLVLSVLEGDLKAAYCDWNQKLGGKPLLHLAIELNNLPLMKRLLELGAKPEETDLMGRTPLHIAVFLNQKHICEELIGCPSVNVNAADKRGNTSLHLASDQRNNELISLLFKHGASLMTKNQDGETPEDIAKRNKHDHILQYFAFLKNTKPNTEKSKAPRAEGLSKGSEPKRHKSNSGKSSSKTKPPLPGQSRPNAEHDQGEELARVFKESLHVNKQQVQKQVDEDEDFALALRESESEHLARAYAQPASVEQMTTGMSEEEQLALARAMSEEEQVSQAISQSLQSTQPVRAAERTSDLSEEEQLALARAMSEEDQLSQAISQSLRGSVSEDESLASAMNESFLAYQEEAQTQEERVLATSLAEKGFAHSTQFNLQPSGSHKHGASKYPLATNPKRELRLLILGMSGAGKSSTGNTIIGNEEFTTSRHGMKKKYYTDHASAEVCGRHVVVVDTPEGFDAKQQQVDMIRETARWMCLSAPGPHAIILVIRGGDHRTEEVQKCADKIMNVFGEDACRHTIILFTHLDVLQHQGIPFVSYISSLPSNMKHVLARCKDRYIAFNNRFQSSAERERQVRALFAMVDGIVSENGGRYFTNNSYVDVEKKLLSREHKLKEEFQKENEASARKLDAEIAKLEKSKHRERERIRAELRRKHRKENEKYEAQMANLRGEVRGEVQRDEQGTGELIGDAVGRVGRGLAGMARSLYSWAFPS